MFSTIVSVITFVGCVWILVNLGAKSPAAVSKINKRIKRTVKGSIKSFLDD